MTLAAERPAADTPLLAQRIDMRCSVRIADGSRAAHTAPDSGRCQLLAGHDGTHALMYADIGERSVLVWTPGETPLPAPLGWQSRPWMRGYPFPAWFDEA